MAQAFETTAKLKRWYGSMARSTIYAHDGAEKSLPSKPVQHHRTLRGALGVGGNRRSNRWIDTRERQIASNGEPSVEKHGN